MLLAESSQGATSIQREAALLLLGCRASFYHDLPSVSPGRAYREALRTDEWHPIGGEVLLLFTDSSRSSSPRLSPQMFEAMI